MPPLALMPATRELPGARAWMRDHLDAGVEGVVISIASTARPRRRSWKVRARVTADAVVGGVIGPLDAPEALFWGFLTSVAVCGGGPYGVVDVARAAGAWRAARVAAAGASVAAADPSPVRAAAR